MHIVLAALFAFAILTLWVPAVWPVTFFQVGIFALCAVVLWRRWPGRVPYPAVALAFAVLWGAMQWRFGLTSYPFDTQTALLRWSSFLATFLAGYCLFQDASVSRWFRRAMVWFASVVAVWATLQTFTSGGKVLWFYQTEYSVIMGPIISRNHYAAFVEAVLPIALYEALRHERNAWLYSGMAAALYASVLASASRAGTVLTTAEILVIVVIMMARRYSTGREVGAVFLRVVLLFGLFTLVVGWEKVWDRFWQPDPMQVRREFSLSSLQMIRSHPLTGTGLGTWPTVYPQYAIVDVGTFANQAHNDWLQFFAEGGVLFGAAIASIFLWSIAPAFRSIWGIGVVAVFLHAIVDYPFSRPALGSWMYLVLGLLAARHYFPHSSVDERSR